ncbi:MAG: preprotein translocase subunit YajC [Syntrophaceae bacterium]|nr:preprotein translocase subunit YajC [Syntrophaceae bacterium]
MGIDLAYAMGPQPGGGQGSQMWSFLPIILIFVIFYFLLIRPQQKRAKEHRKLLEELKVGDYVLTSGGIYGKITGLRDAIITLEISDKVRVKVNRGNIAGVVKPDVMKTD